MLKASYNELELKVQIEGRSPLLIKDGRYTEAIHKEWQDADKAKYPPMLFMCREPLEAIHQALKTGSVNRLNYFIPGSSLKGSWRAHLERILRGMAEPEAEKQRICDPLDEVHSCSKVLAGKDDRHPDFPYRGACPICRLFGYTAQAGRIRISDAIQTAGTAKVVDNNSISRQTGSVLHLYSSAPLHQATFEFTLHVRNFELWHIGLLGYLFEDLKQRRVPLGSGKSKGFGDITATVLSAKLTYLGAAVNRQHLVGIGEVVSAADRTRYGFAAAEASKLTPLTELEARAGGESMPWRKSYQVNPDFFWKHSKPHFSQTWWNSEQSGLLAGRRTRAYVAAPAEG